jgi:hypothetical protein
MRRADLVAHAMARREAETAVSGRWLREQFAPAVLAMLQETRDTADLSRLVGLLMHGSAEVAQATYTELVHP